MLPESVYISRGKLGMGGLADEALSLGHDRLMLLDRWKGAPGKIMLYTLVPKVQHRFPIVYLASAATQQELDAPRVRTPAKCAVVESSASEIQLLAEALSEFIGTKRLGLTQTGVSINCMTFGDAKSRAATITFKRLPEQTEIGPRLVVRHLAWSEKSEGN